MAKAAYRFSHGRLLLDDDSQDAPEIVQEFVSSNGTTVYTAIRWKKSQLCSCNCPGWSFKKTCKHTKKVTVATMSNYIGRNPNLTNEATLLKAGQRQARTVSFNAHDS